MLILYSYGDRILNIYNDSQRPKLHVFSNIINLQEINLKFLASLIGRNNSEINYFVCISPKNYGGEERICSFYKEMANYVQLTDRSTADTNLKRRIYMIKDGGKWIDDYYVDRYHKIFQANLAI